MTTVNMTINYYCQQHKRQKGKNEAKMKLSHTERSPKVRECVAVDVLGQLLYQEVTHKALKVEEFGQTPVARGCQAVYGIDELLQEDHVGAAKGALRVEHAEEGGSHVASQ